MSSRVQSQIARLAARRGAIGTAYVRPPITTYTDACEAPQPMWDGAIPLRTRRVTKPAKAGSGLEPERIEVVEKTYNHPKEVSPSDLSMDSVNGMYCIGNDDLMKTYPEGLGGPLMQLMPPGHPRGFLYRTHSHLINTYISKLPHWKAKTAGLRSLTNGRPGFIFDGETGTGKSALMAQAVHFARSRGIITVYIPNAHTWTHGEWSWPSTILPGFFDVPDAARKFLEMFARAHSDALREWKLRVTPKDLPVEPNETRPESLYDLCRWAHSAPSPASVDRQSVAVKYLLDELVAETEKPILFVVDGMNLFCSDTHFRYPHPHFWKQLQSLDNTDIDMYPQEMPRIPAGRLAFVRGLNRIQHEILNNSPGSGNKFFITSTTRNFKPFDGIGGFEEPVSDKNINKLDEYAPFYPEKDSLLHPIKVENFDDYEYRSFLRFIVNSGELAGLGWGPLWHYASGFERKLYKIGFLSGKNPQRVIDHYHGELVWRTEYQRMRQKQYLLNRGKQMLASRPVGLTVGGRRPQQIKAEAHAAKPEIAGVI